MHDRSRSVRLTALQKHIENRINAGGVLPGKVHDRNNKTKTCIVPARRTR
uniref:Uncharacterized protein n=1 Tax=Iconisemion striatum TaxID=60296 RepID=A0A1A7YKH2_9TELE